MQRRDFVKAMMAATVTAPAALAQQPVALPPQAPKAPAPEPWMRGLLEIKPLPMTPLAPDLVARTDTGFFHPQQAATLRRLCELLQPPYKHYPGAIEAGTPEFLDFLIGASPTDRQAMYREGLDHLESEAQSHFHKPFAALDPTEADQLLRPSLRAWMNDHPPTEPHLRFLNIAHEEIRTATVNSPAWSDAATSQGQRPPNIDLYWYPVDPDLRRTTPKPN